MLVNADAPPPAMEDSAPRPSSATSAHAECGISSVTATRKTALSCRTGTLTLRTWAARLPGRAARPILRTNRANSPQTFQRGFIRDFFHEPIAHVRVDRPDGTYRKPGARASAR